MMSSDNPIYIGIDAGGSKTELLASHEQDNEELNLFGSSGNPARVGFDGAIYVLSELILQAMNRLGDRPIVSVCAGIAGAGRTREQQRIEDGIRAELGDRAPAKMHISHDGEIALEAAFEGESGIILISGTGSVTLARAEDGSFLRAGGWGYLIGDEGSGYVVGSMGLRALAHAFDGGPETALVDLLADSRQVSTAEDLIALVYEEKVPLQKFAPLVIQAARDGDDVAVQIIADQTSRLAKQVRWLKSRCSTIEPQVALLGGLVNESYFRDALKEALLAELPGWRVIRPRNRPVVGAWRMARALATEAAA